MSELALKLIAENKAAHARGEESARRLDIGNCGLTELPEELFDCVWLEELVVSNQWWDYDMRRQIKSQNNSSKNSISHIPLKVDSLKKLTKLVLGGYYDDLWELRDLSALSGLNTLQTLYLSYNRISDLSALSTLNSLHTLYLSYNQISDLSALSALKTLQILYLGYNQIKELSALSTLHAIQELYVGYNEVNDLTGLTTSTTLQVLYLKSNQISDLSPLANLQTLRKLDLSDNPIKGVPISNLRDAEAILGYLKSLREDEQVDNYHLKVNILGSGRIGKTQFFRFLTKQQYLANHPPTHGTLAERVEIADRYIAWFWDFGGQNYHHGFHHIFIREKDFNIVLWRNQENSKNYAYWLGTARNFSITTKAEAAHGLILVQNVWNKPDNFDEFRNDEVVYPESRLTQIYNVGLDCIFTIDVKALHLADAAWDARHQYFRKTLNEKLIAHTKRILPSISKKWLAVKDKLVDKPVGQIKIKKEDFKKKCAPNFDDTTFAGLLAYLEFTGEILYFRNSPALSKYIFPNPPGLSDWIYQEVLNPAFMKRTEKEGVLDFALIEEETGKENAIILKEIMMEFNLLFEEKGNPSNLVIPQFLPENNTSFKRIILELIPYTFCLRFTGFFHESRIFQFISEYSEFIEDNTAYWRYGLLFKKYGIKALVYFNENERILSVHLETGACKSELATEIFDYFIHKRSGPKQKADHVNDQLDGHSFPEKEFLNWRKSKTKLELQNLIDGTQLSTNNQNYIDIKETLLAENNEMLVGKNVDTGAYIRLDQLSLAMLRLLNTKLPKVFISYSRKDIEFKDELLSHLSILERYDLLKAWCCEEITPGKWDEQIQEKLEEADIVIYMVSQNFLQSEYIMEKEVKRGIELVENDPYKRKRLLCVLARECNWKSWTVMEEKFKYLHQNSNGLFSGTMDLSQYQFFPYHQYLNTKGNPVREEVIALERWGRGNFEVRNVAYTAIAQSILKEVMR